MTTQQRNKEIFDTYHGRLNLTIAVVPNSTETLVSIDLSREHRQPRSAPNRRGVDERSEILSRARISRKEISPARADSAPSRFNIFRVRIAPLPRPNFLVSNLLDSLVRLNESCSLFLFLFLPNFKINQDSRVRLSREIFRASQRNVRFSLYRRALVFFYRFDNFLKKREGSQLNLKLNFIHPSPSSRLVSLMILHFAVWHRLLL